MGIFDSLRPSSAIEYLRSPDITVAGAALDSFGVEAPFHHAFDGTKAEENQARDAQDAAAASTNAMIAQMQQSRADGAPARELQSAIAAVGGEQYNRYQTEFVPFENRVMVDVSNNVARAPTVQGAINADLMQKQTPWGTAVRTFGANPNRLLGPESSGGAAIASAAGRGAVTGDQRLRGEEAAMSQNIVNLGRGGGEMAQSGLEQAAGIAARATISDWQYQTNVASIDSRYALEQGRMAADEYSADMGYLSSLLSSGSGVALYGFDRAGGGGNATASTPGGGLPSAQRVPAGATVNPYTGRVQGGL